MKITTKIGEIVLGWRATQPGKTFTLADVYALLPPEHTNEQKRASCRCKLERLRDDHGLIFVDNQGTYRWPITQGTTAMLDKTAPETALSAAFAAADKRRKAYAPLDELPTAKKGIRRTPIDMSRDEWLDNDKYPYWPFERDFIAHGAKLLNDATFDPDHPVLGQNCALVTVAGKGTFKINAMTTSYLALAGKVNFPARVHGVHYYVDTMEEGQVIYKGYDATFTGKGAKDKLVSALKLGGVECKSRTFDSGNGTVGINIALRAMMGTVSNTAFPDVDAVVKQLRYSIRAADSVMLYAEKNRATGVMKSSPAIAAMILSYRKIMYDAGKDSDAKLGAKVEWENFWNSVVDDKGHGNTADPHVRVWTVIKEGLKGSGGSRDVTFGTTERALYCWTKRDSEIGQKVLAVSLETFLPILKKKKAV